MEIAINIVKIIYLIVCFVLIVLVLMQSKEDSGASGTIMGASASNFYEKNKGRTREGRIKYATIALMVAFAVLTIALGILCMI